MLQASDHSQSHRSSECPGWGLWPAAWCSPGRAGWPGSWLCTRTVTPCSVIFWLARQLAGKEKCLGLWFSGCPGRQGSARKWLQTLRACPAAFAPRPPPQTASICFFSRLPHWVAFLAYQLPSSSFSILWRPFDGIGSSACPSFTLSYRLCRSPLHSHTWYRHVSLHPWSSCSCLSFR